MGSQNISGRRMSNMIKQNLIRFVNGEMLQ